MIKNISLILVVLLFTLSCCKKNIEPEVTNEVFQVVEKQAEFNANKPIYEWITDNMVYPTEAKTQNIEGKVNTRFTINKDGTISDIMILRTENQLLDNEAIRIIKSMPKWIPAENRGKAVRSYFSLPIVFKL
jgi:periplasmic protein TonB